jgi:Zn-dependent alcohol dehydrogenase
MKMRRVRNQNLGSFLSTFTRRGVNPTDWKVREGYLKDILPHRFPLIPGWDLSGVVEQVGLGVSRFKRGDEVYSVSDPSRDGAYAKYTVVRESEIAFKPKSLHHVHAAAVPLAALTAWQALFNTAQLQPGEHEELSHSAAVPASRVVRRSASLWSGRPGCARTLTGLLQLAAFSFRTIKSWSGFAGDL